MAELQPRVVSATENAPGDATLAAVGLLRSASLAGLLPPAPAARARPFAFTPQSVTWLASIVYGSIFLANLELVRDVNVRLFGVAQARRAGGAADLVASFVARVGSAGEGQGQGQGQG